MSSQERFTFSVMWREVDDDGYDRDRLKVCTYDTYGAGEQAHAKACAGDWTKPHMRLPEVSTLKGVRGSSVREIRDGRILWRDDRGPMTAEERAAIRKMLAGKTDKVPA